MTLVLEDSKVQKAAAKVTVPVVDKIATPTGVDVSSAHFLRVRLGDSILELELQDPTQAPGAINLLTRLAREAVRPFCTLDQINKMWQGNWLDVEGAGKPIAYHADTKEHKGGAEVVLGAKLVMNGKPAEILGNSHCRKVLISALADGIDAKMKNAGWQQKEGIRYHRDRVMPDAVGACNLDHLLVNILADRELTDAATCTQLRLFQAPMPHPVATVPTTEAYSTKAASTN